MTPNPSTQKSHHKDPRGPQHEEEDEEDLYVILGVASNATMKEIRSAYRQLALRYHPDKQNSAANEEEKQRAARKFTQLAAAYEILSDPGERQNYDDARRNAARRNETYHHPFDDFAHHSGFHFHDPFAVFEQVFASMQRDQDAFFSSSLFGNRDPFGAPSSSFMMDPFGMSRGSLFGGSHMGMMQDMMMHRDPFMSMPMMSNSLSMNPSSSSFFTSSTTTSSFIGGGNFGESVTTTSRTVNGHTVTERTIRKSDGTVHTEQISSGPPSYTAAAVTAAAPPRRSLLPSLRRHSGSTAGAAVVDLVDEASTKTQRDPMKKRRKK